MGSSLQTTRLRLGHLEVDVVTFAEALERIAKLVQAGRGGSVFTPNVDHVVNAEHHAAFREAYAQVSLSLVDGKPLVWASRVLGQPLPEKISGSDLLGPLMLQAAQKQWRVFLFGAGPGVAERAAARLREAPGVDVVGVAAPAISADGSCSEEALREVRQARPHLLLVALGSPKQELFIHRYRSELSPSVALGIGAGLDFIAGAVKRAPAWMSNAGLEWLFRLAQEPKRLWRRYLVNDPQFLRIFWRTWRNRGAST